MNTAYKSVIRVGCIVGLILLIPLVLTIRDGGVEGVGWNWTPSDFLVMGGLMFMTGLVIEVAVKKLQHPLYRTIAVTGIMLAFLALWAELAVGAVEQLFMLLLG